MKTITKIKSGDNFGLKGKARIITNDSITGKEKRVTDWYRNIVVLGNDTGKDIILDRLNSVNTYSLNITHIDIGTSNTAPTEADTQLGAAVARTTKQTGVVSGDKVTFRFFFASADLANGAYWEIGCFVDGSSTVNTGKMFNHLLFGSVYNKGTNEDTTLEVEFTIN